VLFVDNFYHKLDFFVKLFTKKSSYKIATALLNINLLAIH